MPEFLHSPYLIPAALTFALIAAFILWGLRYKRRLQTFTELAQQLQFDLEAIEDERTSQAILAPLAGFHVMDVATGREVRQRLHGTMEGFEVQVIDSIVGGWDPAYPKRALSHEQTQTLIVIRSAELKLPPFAISPKYVVARIFEGKHSNDVYLGPRFVRRNRMATPDEAATREALTEDVVEAAAHNRKLTIEARGDTIVAYQYGQAMRAGEVAPMLKFSLNLAALLRTGSPA